MSDAAEDQTDDKTVDDSGTDDANAAQNLVHHVQYKEPVDEASNYIEWRWNPDVVG